MNEQQETREKEISLTDLIFYCMERWRYILLFMLIMGVLAGAYKYLATVRSNQAISWKEKSLDQPESTAAAGDAAKSDAAGKDEPGTNAADMSETDVEASDIYAQSVESYKRALWESQQNLKSQKEYLDESAVMQIDSYHVSTGTLSYYIDGGDHLDSLLASYRAFILDGRMAEELHAKNKEISIEDLRYLVTFSNSEREAYRLEDNQVIRPKEMVFQIQIRMPDDKLCGSYLKEAEKIIGDYSSQLKNDVAKHSLKLLASVQSERSDAELQSYQTSIRAAYVEGIRNLQTLQTELDAAMSLETEEGADASSAGTQEAQGALANPVISGAKYAVVGIVLGGFFACFVLAVLYIMSGRLQSTGGFAEEFGMPMLGVVRDSGTEKRWFGKIDAWIIRLEEGAYGKLGFEEQVKLAAANVQAAVTKAGKENEVKKIMLAGTMPEKEVASLYAKLVSEIEGLTLSDYTQIVFQADALRKLEDYDGILFLEKKRASESQFIMKERRLALDRGVKILGTVVLA